MEGSAIFKQFLTPMKHTPEEDYSFNCPYCVSEISIRIDFSSGDRQSFIYDCEVCCQPILISLELDPDGVLNFNAEKES